MRRHWGTLSASAGNALDIVECPRSATIGTSKAHAQPEGHNTNGGVRRAIRKERGRVPGRPVGRLTVVIGAQQTPKQASTHEALHFAANSVVATASMFQLLSLLRWTDECQESI